MAIVRDATIEDANIIYKNMREIDQIECNMVSGGDGLQSLMNGIENGLLCRTVVYQGRPVSMYGVTPTEKDNMGLVWLLGTDETRKASDILVKKSKEILDEMLDIRPIIFNYVSVLNRTSIKWLKAIGFSFKPDPVIYGVARGKFYLFYKMKEVNHV